MEVQLKLVVESLLREREKDLAITLATSPQSIKQATKKELLLFVKSISNQYLTFNKNDILEEIRLSKTIFPLNELTEKEELLEIEKQLNNITNNYKCYFRINGIKDDINHKINSCAFTNYEDDAYKDELDFLYNLPYIAKLKINADDWSVIDTIDFIVE